MNVEDICKFENEPNITKAGGTNEHNLYSLSLPIRALRKLQNETRAIQFEFFERIYELETEFQKKYDVIYKRRYEIINGDYVPTETEGNIKDSNVPAFRDDKNTQDQVLSEANDPPSVSGVPLFWLHVLSSAFRDIHENDRPILEHLADIRVRNKSTSERGFILEFDFSPNEYFENSVLTKEYFYTSSDNKMVNEFPVIVKSVGCEIKWKDGKTATYRSWFEFLVTSKAICDSEDEIIAYISGTQKDFEMGYFMKEHVVPKAILYYTGEKNDLFFVPIYNPEYWSDGLSDSSTDDDNNTISSEHEAKKDPEDQPKNKAEDEVRD